jgi:hypothetical protein
MSHVLQFNGPSSWGFQTGKCLRKIYGRHVPRICQSVIFTCEDTWREKFANHVLALLGEMSKDIRSTTEIIEVTVLRKA